ncbi:MAG: aldo/keto reductase [Treponema sp.]|jgi:predicted aldo/keto reductase-like oxidoreductase|nr:aldo/keto reductase [Treponema sp.]
MEYVALGKTKLLASRTSFGALPIQRVKDSTEALTIIRKAYESGINFFDTARTYSDSESKISSALCDVRNDIIIATKSASKNKNDILEDLHTSLKTLRTDYIDIYQLHNPHFVPKPNDGSEIYETLKQAQQQGKIRCIGITSHSRILALDAALSGLYDTVQYPFSLLSSPEEIDLAKMCNQLNVGFIAMKPLCGGLLTNIPLAFGFIRQYENIIPIWGIQKQTELEQLLSLEAQPPIINADFNAAVEAEQQEFSINFCRSCGYCQPCPANIPIENANRMSLLLKRSPKEIWLTPEWNEKMNRIENCTKCGECANRCPYHLKPFETLKTHLADFRAQYEEFNATHK